MKSLHSPTIETSHVHLGESSHPNKMEIHQRPSLAYNLVA